MNDSRLSVVYHLTEYQTRFPYTFLFCNVEMGVTGVSPLPISTSGVWVSVNIILCSTVGLHNEINLKMPINVDISTIIGIL